MLTDEDIERAWLGDQTVAPRGGRITGFSRLASFARAIESAVSASKAAEYAYIRREARNAALEEAAKLSESHMIQLGDLHITALSGSEQNYNTILRRAAKAIRALKDQP